ncbi:MAG: hypothetical protein WAW80_04165 [Candidatus Saccharimonadales bacterium]
MSTTIDKLSSTSNNTPDRLNLGQDYVDGVIAQMERKLSEDNNEEINGLEITTSTIGAPEGFPSTLQVESLNNEREELGPVKFSLRQMAKNTLNLPNTSATWAYGKLFDRYLKSNEKFQKMSIEQQIAHVEKMGKIGGIGMTLGMTGLTLVGISRLTHFNPLDALNDLYEPQKKTFDSNDIKLANNTASLDIDGRHPVSTRDVLPDRPMFEGGLNFHYDPALDPGSVLSGKHHNDFGPGLQINPLDKTAGYPDGTYDLLRNHLPRSPKEFATILSKFDRGGVSNDATSINRAGDIMSQKPEVFQKEYTDFIAYLKEHSKIEEKPITGPYGSYYIVDDGHGNLTVAYDNYVDNGGTMMVITTDDGKVICLRKECGGQPIDFIPNQPKVPASPEVRNHAVANNQPVYNREVPPIVNHPTESQPTITTPPPEIPPITPPPEIPPITPQIQPKNPREDINVNEGLPEQIGMGDVRVGSGKVQTPDQVKPEPEHYEAPKPTKDNTDTALGAKPNTGGGLFGRGQQQQSGVSNGLSNRDRGGASSNETSGKVGE